MIMGLFLRFLLLLRDFKCLKKWDLTFGGDCSILSYRKQVLISGPDHAKMGPRGKGLLQGPILSQI